MKSKVINMFGENQGQQESGKYSSLLETFISPFSQAFTDTEYAEEVFEFAINAWNFGNMKTIMPVEEFQETINAINDQDNLDSVLLQKMIDYKTSKFKKHTNFIVDFELKETKNGPVLSVVTQTEEAYLTEVIHSMENDSSVEDFEENFINRSAIILKPKQPLCDWLNNLHPDEDFELAFLDLNIYLIDDDIEDIEQWLSKKFDKFFTLELKAWSANKKEWPKKRTFEIFKLWFDFEVSQMIYDTEKRPVLKY
ncbi:hypothetical protein [Gelidibacter mesophilus]|uniref:hypothetical protein n=1 Tax=Gelidibacter mesophilus TaxID=169050 RepID=UPI0004021C80|nr:hypothetical protein [Gelidibacter mesophilus]